MILAYIRLEKKFSNHKGSLSTDDMTTESIVAKLMWILGQTDKQDEIARLFYRETITTESDFFLFLCIMAAITDW